MQEFPNRPKVLKKAVLAKVSFNDLQPLKTRKYGHDKDLDIPDNPFKSFLNRTNQTFIKHS